MTRLLPALRVSVLVLAVTLVATNAGARTCGDADKSGTVTVTDGVQTLRAAAGLSSSCNLVRCDVDGSDSLTVTDGVNVLRKAAGLAAPDACPGGTGIGVEESLDALVPFLAFGLAFAGDVSIARVAPTGDVEDPCPDGGTRTKQIVGPGVVQIGFDACRYSSPGLGRFVFNGDLTLSFATSQVQLAVLITDLDRQTPSLVSIDGVLDFVQRNGGGFVGNGQDIVLTVPEGQLTLDLNQLTVDEDGHVLSGGGAIADIANDFTLQRLDFQVTGPGTATLTATFDDQTTTNYVLNLVTGELTEG